MLHCWWRQWSSVLCFRRCSTASPAARPLALWVTLTAFPASNLFHCSDRHRATASRSRLGLDRGTCRRASIPADGDLLRDRPTKSAGSGDKRRFQFGGLRFIAIQMTVWPAVQLSTAAQFYRTHQGGGALTRCRGARHAPPRAYTSAVKQRWMMYAPSLIKPPPPVTINTLSYLISSLSSQAVPCWTTFSRRPPNSGNDFLLVYCWAVGNLRFSGLSPLYESVAHIRRRWTWTQSCAERTP